MFNIEEYKNKIKYKVLEMIKSDIDGVKSKMHDAIDSNDFKLLEELKKEKEALEQLSNKFKNSDLSNIVNTNTNNGNKGNNVGKISDDMQLVFDLSNLKTVSKKELKLKTIPDKAIIRRHSELPILCSPERIYIEDDEYIFKSNKWKDALGEICDYCYSLDSTKYRELALYSNCNRIKGSKQDFNYATVEEGDFKCYHGVWFYVRMSSQEAVKLIFEVLKFMGYNDCELVVNRRKR